MNIRNIPILSIIIFLVSVHTSCVKPEKIPPVLPPVESILLDLSFFKEAGEESTYYNDAVEEIVSWQILINDSFSFQKDLLETVLDNELEYQADKTWLINDILNYNDDLYDILFFCIDETDTVSLKLYFSFFTPEDTIYENLLTYDGISFFDNTQGDWVINKPDTSNTYIKFLTVNWNIYSEENKEIKFTNSLPGGDNGNYILSKDSTDGIYDSYIDLYNKANENHTIIQWNSLTNKGRIQDLLKYSNEDWYCWDENFSNTECN